MTNLLCRLFGHQPPVYSKPGWYSPGNEYGHIRVGSTDGIGRIHGVVEGRCARCEEKFVMARVHIPELKVERSGP